MIVILSEDADFSTSLVLSWIRHYDGDYIRINKEDAVELVALRLDSHEEVNIVLRTGTATIDLSTVSKCWFRRGQISLKTASAPRIAIDELQLELARHLTLEKEVLLGFIYKILGRKGALGSIFREDINKLTSLLRASEAGFLIPKTTVVGNKEDLMHFKQMENDIITKGIQRVAFFKYRNLIFGNYTESVGRDDIEKHAEVFFPSLFQTKLDKAYELRIFYLEGKCYSMAIFSQLDNQTSTDFRKYNTVKPNRSVPYRLPEAVETKIKNFMASLDLNTGSIDMVVTKQKEYVFLEVNPVGQFGMVSYPCNYYLEKKIAKSLIG